MHKRLCACGCGDQVTRKVELQHMNVHAPAVLASQVLDQNRRSIRRKKKSRAIGFPASFHQRLAMGNTGTTDINDDDNPFSRDDSPGPMMIEEDLDEAYGQSSHSGRIASHVEDGKSFQNIMLVKIFIWIRSS
jgi:hypothetical protein